MTAEIAVLNKFAVALAADSAVTIAAGLTQHKVYDSADKLFQLCNHDPIGIMIYNGMQFSQSPLANLICEFRKRADTFDTVNAAALSFLEFLNDYGRTSPKAVKDANLENIVYPIIRALLDRGKKRITEYVNSLDFDVKNYKQKRIEIYTGVVSTFERLYSAREDAKFVGKSTVSVSLASRKLIETCVDDMKFPPILPAALKRRIVEIAKLALKKNVLSSGYTGIVIAGFGSTEQFPTLISLEIDGFVGNALKYVETNTVDIDRSGPRASVIPFAQKEMVERFLFGMDTRIQDQITGFCKKTVSKISEELLKHVEFEDEHDRKSMNVSAKTAEDAFVNGLKEDALERIRDESKREVEDMVEFMPKPELAKMAEALVNLTSIKRRVTRGVETVGGPIDVALISRTEGFIWVKRKHYFEAELNPRYAARVKKAAEWESANE